MVAPLCQTRARLWAGRHPAALVCRDKPARLHHRHRLGLAFAPADYQQGDSFRIIYIHVPSAILSMGAYSTMAVAAFIGLVWQLRMADMTVAAIAPVGPSSPSSPSLPAPPGANPCGAPGGCGMPGSPPSSSCCSSIWVSSPLQRLQRQGGGGPRRRHPGAGRGDQPAHHPLLGGVVEHPAPGATITKFDKPSISPRCCGRCSS